MSTYLGKQGLYMSEDSNCELFYSFHCRVFVYCRYGCFSEGSVLYHLEAVLIHRGPSAYSGHYIAHIKDRTDNNWYKFNDETVEKMGSKSLYLGNEDDVGERDFIVYICAPPFKLTSTLLSVQLCL